MPKEGEHPARPAEAARPAMARLINRELGAAWNRALLAGAGVRDLAGILATRLDRVRAAAERRAPDPAALAERIRVRARFHYIRGPVPSDGEQYDAMTEEGPFIGRERETDLLRALLADAFAGRPATTLVAGEPGVGKTRLLQEFARQATAAGALVLAGECFELGEGTGIPYAPLIRALWQLVGDLDEHEALELAGPGWSQLGGLIADFTGRYEPGGELLLGSQLPVFGAVMRVLRHLGRLRPVVLVFENLHWTDPSTLALVVYLSQSWAGEHALLVCSHRTELPEGHILRRQLAEPDFTRRVTRLRLERFTELETLRLFDSLHVADADRMRRGWLLSEGNAYYAVQLASALAGPDAAEIPESLEELMLDRAGRLSRDAFRLLSIAATAARRVSYRLLSVVSGLSGERLNDALRECREHGVLIRDREHETYVVQHALLREAVYRNEPRDTRIQRHTEMAEAIAANTELGLDEDLSSAVELAHHWYRAGRPVQALVHSVRAAALTARMRAFQEAETHFERALELWRALPEPERVAGITLPTLLVEAADAARWAGYVGRAVLRIEEAISLSDPETEPHLVGELHERLGSYLWEAGRPRDSVEAYRRAEQQLRREPVLDALYARVLAGLATAQTRAGHYEEGLRQAEAAAQLAMRLDARAERGKALNTAGLALALTGRGREGVQLLREALEIAREAEHLEDLFRAYGNLAIAHELAGDLPAAVQVAQEGLERARGLGLTQARQTRVLANNAAMALTMLGRWDEALDLLHEVLMGNPPLQESAYLRLTLAEVELGRGRFDVVDAVLAETSAVVLTDPRFLAARQACVAELALWREDGDPRQALAAVELGLAELNTTEHVLIALRLYAVGARAVADLCERAPAADRARMRGLRTEFAERFAAVEAVSAEQKALARQCAAESARPPGPGAADGWGRAAASWEEVAELWDGLDRPYPAAYARWRQAYALLASGVAAQKAPAARLIDRAAAAAERLQAAPLRERLLALVDDDLIAKLNKDPATLLTPQQLKIARLVAGGKTNRQIGRELVLDEGTIAVHIHNAWTKLGEHGHEVTNRVQLATWIHEHDLLGPDGPSDSG